MALHDAGMNAERRTRITESKRRELAVRASADPRSIDKVLSGGRLGGMANDRVRAVLVAEGLIPECVRADAAK